MDLQRRDELLVSGPGAEHHGQAGFPPGARAQHPLRLGRAAARPHRRIRRRHRDRAGEAGGRFRGRRARDQPGDREDGPKVGRFRRPGLRRAGRERPHRGRPSIPLFQPRALRSHPDVARLYRDLVIRQHDFGGRVPLHAGGLSPVSPALEPRRAARVLRRRGGARPPGGGDGARGFPGAGRAARGGVEKDGGHRQPGTRRHGLRVPRPRFSQRALSFRPEAAHGAVPGAIPPALGAGLRRRQALHLQAARRGRRQGLRPASAHGRLSVFLLLREGMAGVLAGLAAGRAPLRPGASFDRRRGGSGRTQAAGRRVEGGRARRALRDVVHAGRGGTAPEVDAHDLQSRAGAFAPAVLVAVLVRTRRTFGERAARTPASGFADGFRRRRGRRAGLRPAAGPLVQDGGRSVRSAAPRPRLPDAGARRPEPGSALPDASGPSCEARPRCERPPVGDQRLRLGGRSVPFHHVLFQLRHQRLDPGGRRRLPGRGHGRGAGEP